MKLWFMGLMGIALAIAGCGKDKEPEAQLGESSPALPTKAQPKLQSIKLWIGAEEIEAELALTHEQRQAGMMFRKSIGENEGMLFVFPMPHKTGFWMKNVSVPLSVAYMNPAGVILEIHDLHPQDTNTVGSASDQIQFVLETSQGWFQRHSISTGTVVRTSHGPLHEAFVEAPRGRR